MSNLPDDPAPRDGRVPERLPEPVANKLLQRASEIDARLRAGSTVAELREAAKLAGIAAEAFEAALAEVAPEAKKVPEMVFGRADPPPVPSFNYRRFLARLVLYLIPLMVPLVYLKVNAERRQRSLETRSAAPVYPPHELRLSCLSAEAAAAIVKPILMQKGPAARGTRMEAASDQPAILRIATSDQLLQEITVAIAKAESDPSRTCTLKPDASSPSSPSR